jgi:deoxyribodipyrimidine photo-lyase
MVDRPVALVWFRQDLRVQDNTALIEALAQGYAILPVFVLDDLNAGTWERGAASRWWLHESLKNLNHKLNEKLIFRAGDARTIIPDIAQETGAQAVFWNRCYEPWRTQRDRTIKDKLKSLNIAAQSFKDRQLWEPWEILNADSTPYRVFTPFDRKGCLGSEITPPEPKICDTQNIIYADTTADKQTLESLKLLPNIPWYQSFSAHWTVGEDGALAQLNEFLINGLNGYKNDRNRPDLLKISRLSPHIHFGEISIRTIWHRARLYGIENGLESDMDHFCSELGWREFSYSLLYHNPDLPENPLQQKFTHFPWAQDHAANLNAWQTGRTGIPIVDAGMRQLWQTGWMHNRVRMIVASFLVKNLLIPWQEGQKWFWDCLVDADLANNAASWQWVAGCGADAAPYFRIFNPVTQAQKFDPDGTYIRTYIPELAKVPLRDIHQAENLNFLTGGAYPAPIVDLATTRAQALAAFQHLGKL